MEPRIVDQAPMPPGQCLFSQDIDGPWIDLGVVAPWVRPYGYLSVEYVEGIARDVLGMVPGADADAEIAHLRDRVASLGQTIDKLEAFAHAAEALDGESKVLVS